MTTIEIPISSVRGRKVHDPSGRYVGRLVEIEARIDLSAGNSRYVVHGYHVSHFGIFDGLAGTILVRQLIERLGERVGYVCHRVPESDLDLRTLTLRYALSTST